MHLFPSAMCTVNHQESSQMGRMAWLCVFSYGRRQWAVAAHSWLADGSLPQFPTICSVDELWLLQSLSEQWRDHPPLVRYVGQLPCGKDHYF